VSEEPRTWTLHIDPYGLFIRCFGCGGVKDGYGEHVEVVERSAYDAMKERAEKADELYDAAINHINGLVDRLAAAEEKLAKYENVVTQGRECARWFRERGGSLDIALREAPMLARVADVLRAVWSLDREEKP